MTHTEILARLTAALHAKSATAQPLLVAIDGRCAAGKSTLAATLGQQLAATVLHMDDFFLRPKQRTPARLQTPGANVDHERFLQQVLQPLRQGKPFLYRAYNCQTGTLADGVPVQPAAIAIVEGAYACHPLLRQYYDHRVFLTVQPSLQMQRIVARNGADRAKAFATQWIPLEERYIAACGVVACCDAAYESTAT